MNIVDGIAVWLLIDINKCQKFIDRAMLYDKWLKRSSNENNSLYMPKVEAAILEDIPLNWITKVIIYKDKNEQFLKMTINEASQYLKDRVY